MDDKTDAMLRILLLYDSLQYMEWFEKSREVLYMNKTTFDLKRSKLLDEQYVEKIGKFYRLKINEGIRKYLVVFSRALKNTERDIAKEILKQNSQKIWFHLEYCLYLNQRISIFLTCRKHYMTKSEIMKTEQLIKFSEKILQMVFDDKGKISHDDALRFEFYLIGKLTLKNRIHGKDSLR